MHRMWRIAFALTLVLALSAGARAFQSTPSDVMKAFASAANKGEYSAVEKFLSADAMAWIRSPAGQAAGGFTGILDDWTKRGTIKSFDVVKEEIQGERATVTARILYKDGSALDPDVTRLVKENGEWKIAIGG